MHTHVNQRLKQDFFNQSFGSVEELFATKQQPVITKFFTRKRKSIFDGLEISNSLKRQKLESDNEFTNSEMKVNDDFDNTITPMPMKKFVLNFDCKHCPSKFTKFGSFKKHTDISHSPSRRVHEEKPKVNFGDQVNNKISETNEDSNLGAINDHCEKCKKYELFSSYRKPFSPKLHRSLLVEMNIDFFETIGYVAINEKLPFIRPRSIKKLASEEFIVGELKGEGGFAKVFSASWSNGPEDISDVVLKVQKPANDWEWYLLNEVHSRLEAFHHPVLGKGSDWSKSFMKGSRCITYQDGSIIVSEQNKLGTILDMINVTNTVDKNIVEPLAVFVTAEILGLVEMLHSLDFIHGDLKPDNLMLTDIPGEDGKFIQLIDFGKAIDLKCFPKNACFDEFVKTSGLITVEMREKKAYRHHIDYFGIAAIAYCLLFGQYLDVKKDRSGLWGLKSNLKRWWKVDFWKSFFDEFLNINVMDRDCLPSLISWRRRFLDLYKRENMQVGLEKAKSLLRRKVVTNRRRTM